MTALLAFSPAARWALGILIVSGVVGLAAGRILRGSGREVSELLHEGGPTGMRDEVSEFDEPHKFYGPEAEVRDFTSRHAARRRDEIDDALAAFLDTHEPADKPKDIA